MKKAAVFLGTLIAALLLVSSLFLPVLAVADENSTSGHFGLGAIFGDPTAVTAKDNLGSNRAVDFGLGYSWGHSLTAWSDYLFEFPGVFKTSSTFINELKPYVGAGGEFQFYDSSHERSFGGSTAQAVFSARFLLGLSWNVPRSPVEIYAEVAPLLNLAPGINGDAQGGLGFRIYF